MTLNPALSARLSRSGIVAAPSTKYLPNGVLELRFLLAEQVEQDISRAESLLRVTGAQLDRSIIGSGDGWNDRWSAECERADAVCAAHFDIYQRHIFLKNGLVVVHFRDKQAESCRWVEGLGWVGW